MVNYRYKDRFSRDSVYKDLVIVNHAAVVTGVDSEPPSITGANYIITNSDIDDESFKLYEKLCSQPNLAFGACEASKVTFTIYSKSIPTLTDEWIDIYLYFEGDSSTLFRIGTYLVNSDKLSADRTKRVITAFDSLREMLNLDITDWYHSFFSGTHGMATIKQMRDSLFDYYTQQEIVCSQENVTLPNDNFVIVKTLKEDIFGSTLLPAICELNGCFGHVDRSGVFRYIFLKDYTDSPDAVITDNLRKGTTTYEDYRVPSICKLVVYDSDGNVLGKEAVSGKQVYKIHGNPLLNAKKPPEVVNLTKNIYSKLQYKRYTPCKVPAMGNLCIEVGDYIAVEGKDAKFKSYVLSRTFSGIQTLTDTYESKGERKAPKKKGSGASSAGDYSSSEWAGSDIGGSGGSAGVVGTDLVELIRNFGFRLLDEPQDAVFAYDKNEQKVSISWRDPADLEGDEPAPVKWAGTVVVRKEDSPPIHIWDEGAEVLVDSTTRDEYAEEAFVDSNVPANKRFYYGVFPYDDDGIVKHYRWTKVFSINSDAGDIAASVINSASASGLSITVNYSLVSGQYAYRKLVFKAGSIPRNSNDGTAVNISSSGSYTIQNLLSNTTYYVAIFEQSASGSIAQSNIVDAKTGSVLGLLNYNGVAMDSRLAYSSAIKASQGYSQFNYYNNNEYLGYTSSNLYNVGIAFGTPFTRGNYKRICAEIEIPTGANWGSPNPPGGYLNHSEMIALGTKPNTDFTSFFENWLAWAKCTDFETMTNYSKTTPWSTMPRTVVKMDITRIASDRQFYLAFFKCDCTMKIYRIWFES